MPKPIIQVHHRGDRGVDGILRLIELASHDGPIETMLTAMCDQVAAIADVDIASIYVVEGDDDALVMRGNHGFPRTAIGTTLAVGEGITGLVAECMRPISAAHAEDEASFKPVPGLGEDQFPVFVGVPLIAGGATVGVLVMQRRKRPFAVDEVTLATALGAPITLAVERRRASAIRSARLVGTGHGGGIVLGRAGVVPTTTAMTWRASAPTDVDRALGRLRDDMNRAVRRIADVDDAPLAGAALDRLALALVDQRLRERMIAAATETSGLRGVAKDYARATHKLGTALEAAERVAEIEELCALVGATADSGTSQLGPGRIWIADQVGAFLAVAAVARGATAVLASSHASPAAIEVARAANLPLVTEVSGLFSWARANDLLAVDGDAGTVHVHPAPSEIERLRRERVPDE